MPREIADSRQHWINLKAGDQAALAAIYQDHAGHLLSYALTITADRDVAKDCVQQLFVNLWEQRQNLIIPVSVKAYLVVSLRNIAIRQVTRDRKRADMHVLSGYDNEQFEPDAGYRREQTDHEGHRNRELYANIGMLSKRQQEVIHLRFIQELDYTQIADITGLNYQGARNLIYKALQSLRKQMILPLLALLLVS